MKKMNRISTYTLIKQIGCGSYGVVYLASKSHIVKANEVNHKDLVAIKRVANNNYEYGVPTSILREISILSNFKHPNIVNLLEVIHQSQFIYLVFEYCRDGDLRQMLSDNIKMSRVLEARQVKLYMKQLFEACHYLHIHQIIHRDIKPANILITNEGETLKICDFGLSRVSCRSEMKTNMLTPHVVTLWYRAPELLFGDRKYSEKVDIWALGCCFVELLLGTPLFIGDSEVEMIMQMFRFLGTPDVLEWKELNDMPNFSENFPKWSHKVSQIYQLVGNLDPEAADLIEQLLQYNPRIRPSAKKVLQHKYFQNL